VLSWCQSPSAAASFGAYLGHMTNANGIPEPSEASIAATGIRGLDALLRGGLPRAEMHLVQGTAGTGKTTLALQYLREGSRTGETTLYVTLSQSKTQLERIARSHGWTLDGINVHELAPGTLLERIADRQTIFPSAEVELIELFRELQEQVELVRPQRAVIDSITIIELLAGNSMRYHHEVVLLRQLFIEHGCTLVVLADHPAEGTHGQSPEVMIHPLSGCVIELEQEPRPFGNIRRHMLIVKARGVPHNGGYHDMEIHTGNMEVYPRLGAYSQPESRQYTLVPSGVESIDALLGGGLNTGTSCLIVGASGAGKSSIATQFAAAYAQSGGRATIYLFDERPETYLARSEQVGVAIRAQVEAGRVAITQLDPGDVAPGQFAQRILHEVEHLGTKLVVIDSVVGYFAAMGSADVLMTQLHELMTYLTRRDVLLILCGAQEGFMSIGIQNAVDVSYLSDTVIVLDFFVEQGDLCRALVVVKKKFGGHSTTIHRFSISDGHLHAAAEPLLAPSDIMVRRQAPKSSGA
jgi:circadian clock protein KaiC